MSAGRSAGGVIMALIKHRTRYFPYFNLLQDAILMKRHTFKDPILYDVDWFLHYVARMDDRELLKIGEFQKSVRNGGFVPFYSFKVLDSYFRCEVRNSGDDKDFIVRFRERVAHIKFFFNVLAGKDDRVLSSQDISGCEKAIDWLERQWESKSDEELQAWVQRIIDTEGFGTEVFIDFMSLSKNPFSKQSKKPPKEQRSG